MLLAMSPPRKLAYPPNTQTGGGWSIPGMTGIMRCERIATTRVAPSHQPWSGLVQRVECGKALIAIDQLRISADLYRMLAPPTLCWVPLEVVNLHE